MKSGGPSLPNPLSSPPYWGPWDLFRSFKVCSDAKERVGCGKQREATATLVSEFAVEELPLGRTAALVPAFAGPSASDKVLS